MPGTPGLCAPKAFERDRSSREEACLLERCTVSVARLPACTAVLKAACHRSSLTIMVSGAATAGVDTGAMGQNEPATYQLDDRAMRLRPELALVLVSFLPATLAPANAEKATTLAGPQARDHKRAGS